MVNGEKDYNDGGVFDRSEIIATLNLVSNGQIIEPSANSQITFEYLLTQPLDLILLLLILMVLN